jgi:histidinol phosphatase-like enzyme (inositol monophosphatase family)
MRAMISADFPDHSVLGEEYGGELASEGYQWILDPIDGTRAFITGMPTWGTLLGLVVDGEPVAGLVHQPYTDETWLADPRRGARFLHAGTEAVLATRRLDRLAEATLVSTHPSMLVEAGLMDRYVRLAAQCRLQRWGGDCYAFALLAHGTVDLVVDADLKPYDIVPLVPVIERAGGVVTGLDGRRPLDGGTVVAAGTPALHAAALALLRGESP